MPMKSGRIASTSSLLWPFTSISIRKSFRSEGDDACVVGTADVVVIVVHGFSVVKAGFVTGCWRAFEVSGDFEDVVGAAICGCSVTGTGGDGTGEGGDNNDPGNVAGGDGGGGGIARHSLSGRIIPPQKRNS